MLYIFSKDEKLVAILKPDFGRTTIKTGVSQAFLHTEYPAAFDRAEVEGCSYFDAAHTEKLTGENTFTFSVPANHPDAQYITEGNLVAFKDLDGNWQLFEIKRVIDTHDEDIIRTAFCEHAFYELIDDFIEDKRPYNTTASYALEQALEGTRWQVSVVDDLGLNSVNFYYESVLSAIQKVANTWGGELQFRIAVVGNTIAARYVDLLSRRGAETGKQFVYSKDIKSIEREVDLTQVVTALYGRGKGEQIEEGYGRRITFEDVEWSVSNGDPADKPLGQKWVGDPEALARWGRPGGRHRFGVFEDSEEEDPAVLLQKTWEELQRRKNPRITYKLDVADLERLTGYEHEKVRLGDTVRVIDRAFSPELLVEARVIEIQRDLLQPENTKITLGNFAPSIVDETIKQEQIRQTVSDRQGVWDRANQFNPDGTLDTEWLNGIIDTLRNEVRAGRGTVTVTDNNGILIVDDPDNPTKALRLLGGMFAIANSKDPVTGEWNWRTFGDGKGFVADLINTGILDANLIKTGTIKSHNGNVSINLDNDNITIENGAIIIKDRNNQSIITANGLKVKYVFISSGELKGWQKVGIWNEYGNVLSHHAFITAAIPTGLTIESAILICKSMPRLFTGWTGIPDGYYHARNLQLFKIANDSAGYIDFPAYSEYDLIMDVGGQEITNQVWGSRWSPTGQGVKYKEADVKDYLSEGRNVFLVKSADSISQANEMYGGGMQFELIVTGYLRG